MPTQHPIEIHATLAWHPNERSIVVSETTNQESSVMASRWSLRPACVAPMPCRHGSSIAKLPYQFWQCHTPCALLGPHHPTCLFRSLSLWIESITTIGYKPGVILYNYCPFRGFCVDEAKKSCVCVCVRPEKQWVLSRSFSTDHIFSFRGKGSTSDSPRCCKNRRLRRWEFI